MLFVMRTVPLLMGTGPILVTPFSYYPYFPFAIFATRIFGIFGHETPPPLGFL
jgi:hypothetical protein